MAVEARFGRELSIMPVQPVSPAILRRHRDTPAGPLESIKAFPCIEGRLLRITYALCGKIERVRLPLAQRTGRTDGLWQHTCFEAFVGRKGTVAYYEFNFSPAGQWAVYSFRNYRDAAPVQNHNLEPRIAVRRQANILELNADVRLDRLPAIRAGTSLRLGLSAVIEDTEGRLSYWALKHPPGKPDFHYPENFILHFKRP
jgi:hypothetical protein